MQAYFGSVHFIWPVYSTSSFIVNCVPGNAKIKLTISREYQEFSQSQTGVQRMHWLLHSKQGWCSNYFAYYKQELHKTRARMQEATEPGCLVSPVLWPGSDIRRWRTGAYLLQMLLSGNRSSTSKQQTDVNFLESSEPTEHVQ